MPGKCTVSTKLERVVRVKLIHRVGLKFDASGVDLNLGFMACNALDQYISLYIFPLDYLGS